jgi:peptide-methionine (R)-S-oxide reductase
MNKNKKNLNHISQKSINVTQKSGTEPPFSGELLNEDRDGMYHCIVCDHELFSSQTKFDSASGWPSFHAAVADNIQLQSDDSLGMNRTEVLCGNCGAHLGHVFNDGPKELSNRTPASGKRFCVNSCALNFSPEKKMN